MLAGIASPSEAFSLWLSEERARFRALALSGFKQLADKQREARQFADLEVTARRLVEIDGFDEEARRLLMESYNLQGRRNGALSIYREFAAMLQDELDVSPEQETVLLYDSIRNARQKTETTAPVTDETSAGNTDSQNREAELASSHTTAEMEPREKLPDERKPVTLLFARVFREALPFDDDPDKYEQQLAPVQKAILECIEARGGIAVNIIANELCTVFGGSVSMEDHAVRAGEAALAIQALSTSSAVKEETFSTCVALHGADVVMRQNPDPATAPIIGNSVGLVCTLGRNAAAGSIQVTASWRDMCEGFFLFEQIQRPDVENTEEIFELTGKSGARSRWDAWLRRGLSPMIGREEELDALEAATEFARRGNGSMVMVVGEAGIGKSRLVHEFLSRGSARMCGLQVVAANSIDKAIPLHPIRDMVRGLLGDGSVLGAEEARIMISRKFAGKAKISESTILAVVALSVAREDSDSAWMDLDPQTRRSLAIEAVRLILAAESSNQPLVLVFEDLHWIDDETHAVLNAIVDSLPGLELLFVVTCRPEFKHDWGHKNHIQMITLDSLSPEQSQTLLESVLRDDEVAEARRTRIIQRADGVPMFIEEIARNLSEPGGTNVGQDDEIPSTIHSLLAARIDRLHITQKSLVQLMAVFADRVSADDLVHCIANPAQVRADLDALTGAGFVRQATIIPESTFELRHALTAEAAYRSLLDANRQEMHLKILGLLEQADSKPDHHAISRMGYHAVQAHQWEKAAHWLKLSGDLSAEMSAYATARDTYQQAIAVLDELSPDEKNSRTAIDLRIRIRPAAVPLGDFGTAISRLDEAEKLAKNTGDANLRAEIAVGKSYIFSTNGRLRDSETEARNARDLMANSSSQLLHEARLSLGQALTLQGKWEAAIATLSLELGYWETVRHERFGHTGTRSIWCYGLLSHAAVVHGNIGDALGYARRAVEIADETNRPLDQIFALHRIASAFIEGGRHEEGSKYLHRTMSLVNATNAPIFSLWLSSDLVVPAHHVIGQMENRETALREALENSARLGLAQFGAWARLRLAECLLAADQPKVAADHARAASKAADELGDRILVAASARVMGHCVVEPDASMELHDKAVDHAVTGQFKPELVRCLRARAQTHRHVGDDDHAKMDETRASKIEREFQASARDA